MAPLGRYWAPVAGYCAAIYMVSSVPAKRLAFTLFPHADKVIHALEYGLLGILLARAFGLGTGGLFRRAEAVAAAVLFCVAFGALDEVHQSYVPGRSLEFLDLFADVGGASLAALANAKLMIEGPARDGATP